MLRFEWRLWVESAIPFFFESDHPNPMRRLPLGQITSGRFGRYMLLVANS
jgi:hypothetical protein